MAEIKKVQPKLTMKMLYEMIEQQQESHESLSKLVAEQGEKMQLQQKDCQNTAKTVESQSESISKIVSSLDEAKTHSEKTYSELQTSVAQIRKQVTELQKTCKDLAGMISGASEKVSECSNKIGQFATRQEQDEAIVQRCSENITAANNNVETLIGQLNTVAQKTLQNIDSIKTLVNVYQQLQSAVKNIKVEPEPMDTLKRLISDVNQMVNGQK